MSKKVEIKWLSEPEEHDYPAALAYLALLYDEQTAKTYVDKLRLASVSEFKAKDIFRASGLSLLGVSNNADLLQPDYFRFHLLFSQRALDRRQGNLSGSRRCDGLRSRRSTADDPDLLLGSR